MIYFTDSPIYIYIHILYFILWFHILIHLILIHLIKQSILFLQHPGPAPFPYRKAPQISGFNVRFLKQQPWFEVRRWMTYDICVDVVGKAKKQPISTVDLWLKRCFRYQNSMISYLLAAGFCPSRVFTVSQRQTVSSMLCRHQRHIMESTSFMIQATRTQPSAGPQGTLGKKVVCSFCLWLKIIDPTIWMMIRRSKRNVWSV